MFHSLYLVFFLQPRAFWSSGSVRKRNWNMSGMFRNMRLKRYAHAYAHPELFTDISFSAVFTDIGKIRLVR